jgi:WD40 repeat protein
MISESSKVWNVGEGAFGPDGRYLAVFGTERKQWQVRLWTVEPFAEVAKLDVDEVSSIGFAAPELLVVGLEDGSAFTWSVASRKREATLSAHRDAVTAIAGTRSGDRFATADRTGEVRLYARDGKRLGESRDLRGHVSRLGFSPDAATLVAAADEPRLIMWDARLLQPLRVTAFSAGVGDIVWSADSSRFVTHGRGETVARVWRRPAPRQELRTTHLEALGGPMLAIKARTGLALRDLGSPAAPRELTTPTDWHSVDLARDGKRLLIQYLDVSDVYDVASGKRIARHKTKEYVKLSSDGRFLFELTGDDVDDIAQVTVIDAASGTQIERLRNVARVDAAGGTLIGLVKGVPQTWSTAGTGPIIAAGLKRMTVAQLDPTGRVYAAFGADGGAIVESATGRVLAKLAVRATVTSAELDQGATRVAVHHADRTLAIHAVATGELLATVSEVEPGSLGALGAFALSPDGAVLATGSHDGRVRIWEAATGRLLDVLHGHRDPVKLVRFSAGRLVTADMGVATVWNLEPDRRPNSVLRYVANHIAWKLVDGRPVAR